MQKIFEVLSKPARLILIIAAFAYAGLYAVVSFGSFDGGFLAVVGGLIVSVLTIAAVVAVPVLLLLKKEEAAKLVFILVAGYWLVSNAQSYLLNYSWWAEGDDGLRIVIAIFGFLAGLALTGVLVLLILNFILKKEVFKLSAVLAFAGAFLFIFILVILLLVYYIKTSVENDYYNVPWTNYVSLLLMLAAPVAVLFGYLYFLGAPSCECLQRAPKEKKPEANEPAPEVEKEAAPEEAPVE